jgi:hypothetical protein
VCAGIGTAVNGQDLGHSVGRQGTGGDLKIEGFIQLPLVPDGVDHSDIQIGLGVLNYQILHPSDHLVPALDQGQDELDLLGLLVGQLPNRSDNPFPNRIPFAVRFGDGVRFVFLSLVAGGTVAQMHGGPPIFLRLHNEKIVWKPFKYKVSLKFSRNRGYTKGPKRRSIRR